MSAPETATSSTNPAADSNESHEVKAEGNGNGAIKDEKPAATVKEEAVAEPAANGDKDSAKVKDERTDERQDRDDRNGHRRKTFNDRKAKKNEFENLKETDDPDAIRQQVEFYFSTHNLSTDWHLFKEMYGPKNRPVPIKHIHSFKRMVRFQPYSAVVGALKESDQLDVVEDGGFAGKGKEGVKRKVPVIVPGYDEEKDADKDLMDLHEILWFSSQNNLDKSIYVKNFRDAATVGQIELEDFFKPYGSVMVRKRRDNDTGDWKGSVFVEFDTEESQQNFLNLDPKPQFRGNDLEIMSKKAYSLMKCEEKGITPSWMSDDPGNTRRAYPFRRGNQNRGRGGDRQGGHGRGRGQRGTRGGQGRFKRDRDNDYNDRHRRDRRRYDSRSRSRSRSESRSPRERRHRDRDEKRSRSRSSSGDRDDWNNRRDKFQKSDNYRHKDRRGDRRDRDRDYGKSSRSGGRDRRDRDRDDRKERGPDRDERGVPVVKDTREKDLKRKADDEDRENSPKKTKVEIVEDA